MIPDNVVFLWEGGLKATDETVSALRSKLSSDELVRADRFRFDRHRRRYIVARATLRALLAKVLDIPPADVSFSYGAQGKPWISGGPEFNLSHTGDRVLIGITAHGRLGVDIEEIKAVREMDQLAKRNFSVDESDRLTSLATADRPEMFFKIWTRKEAFLKALGGGLSIPLHSFSIDPTDAHPEGLLRVDDPAEHIEGWLIRGVHCRDGAKAAIALDRPGAEVRPLPFSPEPLY